MGPQSQKHTEKKMFGKYGHKIFYQSDDCDDGSCGGDAAAADDDDGDGDRIS
jgi:hypothetical protein